MGWWNRIVVVAKVEFTHKEPCDQVLWKMHLFASLLLHELTCRIPFLLLRIIYRQMNRSTRVDRYCLLLPNKTQDNVNESSSRLTSLMFIDMPIPSPTARSEISTAICSWSHIVDGDPYYKPLQTRELRNKNVGKPVDVLNAGNMSGL